MKAYWILLSACLVLMLSACGSRPDQIAGQAAEARTAPAVLSTPTPAVTNTPTPEPSQTPTLAPSPTATERRLPKAPTNDSDRYYAPDGSFSFLALDGWEPQESPMEYPDLIGPEVAGYPLSLIFIVDYTEMWNAGYTAQVQDMVLASDPEVETVSEGFLVTDGGQDYFRWEYTSVYEGRRYHYVSYIIEGDMRILHIIYTRLDEAGEEYDQLVDASLQSMIIDQ
ncbi:MAG: hypothetical protein EHM70_11405 [Chloroflexota bacterium]|nr:MAG: hypothetical protein EHM70_11405 [Chloroflexota bacterium]